MPGPFFYVTENLKHWRVPFTRHCHKNRISPYNNNTSAKNIQNNQLRNIVQVSEIILHSKYFPVSDWFKPDA